jgi:hypothetical protein
MQIQNFQNTQSHTQNSADIPANNLSAHVGKLAKADKAVLDSAFNSHSIPQANVQQLLHRSFSVQREKLAGQAGSSTDIRRTALDVL